MSTLQGITACFCLGVLEAEIYSPKSSSQRKTSPSGSLGPCGPPVLCGGLFQAHHAHRPALDMKMSGTVYCWTWGSNDFQRIKWLDEYRQNEQLTHAVWTQPYCIGTKKICPEFGLKQVNSKLFVINHKVIWESKHADKDKDPYFP